MIYGKHVSKHAYLVSYINYSHDEDKSCSTFEIYVVCETCAHFSFFLVHVPNEHQWINTLINIKRKHIKHIYQCFHMYILQ